MIKKMLEHNKAFVESKQYEQYRTSKYPDKKVAIVTCMDTRLVELLPAALGIKNGDVKMIKNAGGMITEPFDSSILNFSPIFTDIRPLGGYFFIKQAIIMEKNLVS